MASHSTLYVPKNSSIFFPPWKTQTIGLDSARTWLQRMEHVKGRRLQPFEHRCPLQSTHETTQARSRRGIMNTTVTFLLPSFTSVSSSMRIYRASEP